MQIIQDKLKEWRETRNLQDKPFVKVEEVANVLEEYTEFLRAKDDNEKIDGLCDMCVFSYNILKEHRDTSINAYDSILSALDMLTHTDDINVRYNVFNTVISLCEDYIVSMGYDYELCMLETIAEIGSRKQDPEQAKDWAENGVNGKWQKDKEQDKNTLYKANYEACKL